MKIIQTKDYKKPLYAIGVAAALTAIAVTGCGEDKPIEYAGDLQPMTETTDEVELAGEETVCTDGTEKLYSKPGDDDEVVLAGETTVEYAGDVTEYTDETEPVNTRQSTERVTLDGGVEFADPGQEN
ncbi:MAG: hypothetical protein IKM96_00685 [Clostridiales bacterium]|nr:hypothetical protein [Clostridiales bacterium]